VNGRDLTRECIVCRSRARLWRCGRCPATVHGCGCVAAYENRGGVMACPPCAHAERERKRRSRDDAERTWSRDLPDEVA
jgi:hypothetical protein